MSQKVYFDLNAGACYTKGKKRMRGEIIKGPEIKKWNSFIGAGTGPSSIDFVNNINYSGTNVAGCYVPQSIVWPSTGSGDSYRVGNRINLLGIRFKGWLTLATDQLMQIRWRLVFVRMDIPDQSFIFSRQTYLQQFENSDDSVPSSFDIANYSTFCRHNFYKKFKNVNNKAFKAKTIASGCLPATNEFKKLTINLDGTVAGQAALLTVGNRSNYIRTVRTEAAGYIPVDVTVKLNDTVDCLDNLRRYYVVLETDVGYGWTAEGSSSASEVGLLLNIYARGYYTDA